MTSVESQKSLHNKSLTACHSSSEQSYLNNQADEWDLVDLISLVKKYKVPLTWIPLALAIVVGISVHYFLPEWRSEMLLTPALSVINLANPTSVPVAAVSEERLQAIVASDEFKNILSSKLRSQNMAGDMSQFIERLSEEHLKVEFDRKRKLLKVALIYKDPQAIETISPLIFESLIEASRMVGIQEDLLREWLVKLKAEESSLLEAKNQIQLQIKKSNTVAATNIALLDKLNQSYSENTKLIKAVETLLRGIDKSSIVAKFSAPQNSTKAMIKALVAGVGSFFVLFFLVLIRESLNTHKNRQA